MNKKLLIIGIIASLLSPLAYIQAKSPKQATLLSPTGIPAVVIVNTDVAQDYFKAGYVLDSKFKPLLGAVINQAPSLFETSLASAISNSATTMTLVSGKDRSGQNLSGNICFTIDSGLTTTEFVCGVANGVIISSLIRGIAPDGVTSTSSLKFAHRYGSDVKVTDFPVLQQYGRILNGQDSLPNKIFYDSSVNIGTASSSVIATKGYVDTVGAGGFTAANASTTQGVQVFGTAPETIGVKASSTGGIGIDGSNGLYIKASSTSGLKIDSVGVYIDTSHSFNWSGSNSFASTTFSGSNNINMTLLTAGEYISAGNSVIIGDGVSTTTTINQTTSDTALTLTSNNWIGQTYTATGYGIKQVSLNNNSIAANFVNVKIYATSGGLPTGSALASSGSFSLSNAQVYDIPLTTLATTTPGTVYAIIVEFISGTPAIFYNTSSIYSGGNKIVSTNGGSSWSANATQDLYFSIKETMTESGKVYKSNAAGQFDLSRNFIGFSLGNIATSSSGYIINNGVVNNLSGLVAGNTYYLSNTPGSLSLTPGTFNNKIGLSISSTSLLIKHINQ